MRYLKRWIHEMIQYWKEKGHGHEEGFTFVELMIVVAIIGILAAIAIPQFSKASDKAYEAQVEANKQVIMQAAQMYYVEHPDAGEVTVNQLVTEGYLQLDAKKLEELQSVTVSIKDGKIDAVTIPKIKGHTSETMKK